MATSKNVLESYGTWLDDEGYDCATEYLELITLKQSIKWLVQEKKQPITKDGGKIGKKKHA